MVRCFLVDFYYCAVKNLREARPAESQPPFLRIMIHAAGAIARFRGGAFSMKLSYEKYTASILTGSPHAAAHLSACLQRVPMGTCCFLRREARMVPEFSGS